MKDEMKEIHVVAPAAQSGPRLGPVEKVFCIVVWMIVLYGVLSR